MKKNNNNDFLKDGIMDSALAAEQEEIKSRKLKYGTIATIFSVIFLVAVLVVNIFVGYMTDRFVLEIDLTRERLFEISEDTKEVIDALAEQITITVLADETTYRDSTDLLSNIHEVLQRYTALAGGKISVRYVNPNLNPQIVERYNALGNILSNDIIIESDRRFKKLSPQNLYSAQTDSNTGTTYYVGLRAEQRLTSAILFVTSEVVSKAAYVRGHDENYSIPELDTLLNYSNYEVTNVFLSREDIPEDVSLLIIHSPKVDFYETEIEKLDEFLMNGGDLIVAMVPEAEELPNLNIYFEEWGIRYSRDIIYDPVESVSGYPHWVVPSINIFEGITSNLSIRNQYVVTLAGRPIVLTGTQTGDASVTPLMTTSEHSFAKNYADISSITDFTKTENDSDGPFHTMVISERVVADKNLNYTRSCILFTSTGFMTDSVLKQHSFLNRTYLGSALNYIADYSEGVVIPDKRFESNVLTILSWQANLIFWIVVVGIPAAIILLSIIVWFRRRHL